MEKKRVIVDYKNITEDLLRKFTDAFPRGYDEDDIIRFKNAKGEWVNAVPLETEDSKYLIKVGVEMDRRVEAFLDDEDDSSADAIDEDEVDLDDDEELKDED
jgi:DNA-directed RNA polymerase subunit delta